MTFTDRQLLPPISPGEILMENFMQEAGVSVSTLANALNVPLPVILSIISGDSPITAELALRLSRYWGVSADFWLNIQQRYDLDRARDALEATIQQQVTPYRAA